MGPMGDPQLGPIGNKDLKALGGPVKVQNGAEVVTQLILKC